MLPINVSANNITVVDPDSGELKEIGSDVGCEASLMLLVYDRSKLAAIPVEKTTQEKFPSEATEFQKNIFEELFANNSPVLIKTFFWPFSPDSGWGKKSNFTLTQEAIHQKIQSFNLHSISYKTLEELKNGNTYYRTEVDYSYSNVNGITTQDTHLGWFTGRDKN